MPVNKLPITRKTKCKAVQYGVQMSKKYVMNAACTRGIGSYSNSNPGHNNSKLATNMVNKTVSIKASKTIPAGHEILTSYGNNYFQKRPNTLPKPVFFNKARKVTNKTAMPPRKRARR